MWRAVWRIQVLNGMQMATIAPINGLAATESITMRKVMYTLYYITRGRSTSLRAIFDQGGEVAARKQPHLNEVG